MSLASLLLGGSQISTSTASRSVVQDNELDALFRSNPAPPPAVAPIHPTPSYASPAKTGQKSGLKRKRLEQAGLEHPLTAPAAVIGVSNVSKRQRAAIIAEVDAGDTSEDGADHDAWLEDSYFSRRTTRKNVAAPETGSASASESSSEADDDENALPPVHETHVRSDRSNTRSKTQKAVKYIPPDETPAQRDARTVFIGNVPIAVVKSKSLQKQLKRHFYSLINGSKIESIRFRSVAFASATTPIPINASSRKEVDTLSAKKQRQQDRAAQWRDLTKTDRKVVRIQIQGDDGETSEREDSHSNTRKASYLTPAERKRVALIKGEFHKAVDTVNAYLVFAYHKVSQESESSTGKVAQLHPFEAARMAVEQCDGTLFIDRTIRVDRVGEWRAGIGGSTVGIDSGGLSDPDATLFVGNLDFAAREEDLRAWFEGVVSQERGPPEGEEGNDPAGTDGTGGRIPQEKHKPIRWVRSVRIVRDRDTQLGKGFAYVCFLDRECVDELFALEPVKLKFAKRKLRIQRCKANPGSLSLPSKGRSRSVVTPHAKKPIAKMSTASLPKGDPSLGEKLAGLSKDERKAAKAINIERIQRRLAKKKLKEGIPKAQGGKERTRERTRFNKNRSGGSAKAVNKGRIRSERSMAKRNVKK